MPDAANLPEPLVDRVRDLAHRLADQQRVTAAVKLALSSLLPGSTGASLVTSLGDQDRVVEIIDKLLERERAVEQILAKIGGQLEDLIDIVEAEASLAEPSESIPWEQVKAELGID